MNVKEMIKRLQSAVEHGQNPEATVMAWDAARELDEAVRDRITAAFPAA